ncbi:succinate dehydrogenase cytochrome b subunit [Kocuria sp.]|uniref:succinate dehydrogenase cytochrome b subunit n=1 Tax=Kocuria sp. TaxID=1871328 RepID=UPI0026E054AD|nr:succinate dehydrogenase cytochrome b subunit [Kocuria sp.]MDO5619240.1 succinate dehydrogenase cytochrome b subunit [Kocuria sp.]
MSTLLNAGSQVSSTPRAGRSGGLPSVYAKLIMAATGAIFAIFVLVHMIGNLKIYQGEEAFNSYAHWLRVAFYPVLPYEGLLWIMRVVLLACLVAHVYCALLLRRRGATARGRWKRKGLGLDVFAARTMMVTGVVLLLFIIFHILDLTLGMAPAGPEGFEHATHDASYAYANLVASFSRWPVALFYIIAMACLALHLAHGVVSAVVDFGVGLRPRVFSALAGIGLLFGLIVAIGNITIPVAVLTGVIQ